jgi:hypothetical protein
MPRHRAGLHGRMVVQKPEWPRGDQQFDED